MVMSYPKRLIEVDLPIKEISAHARREKSIRHGHISTLHIWWARRPLAACRAVLCATLWPDPVDELCPQAFRDAVAVVFTDFAELVRSNERLAGLCRAHWSRWKRTTSTSLQPDNPACWPDMRYALLDFIADFANWDASLNSAFLDAARTLTRCAHMALSDPEWRLSSELDQDVQRWRSMTDRLAGPLIIDPFAGGGAIPLEALRVGAGAFASDLNPVAVLLNKALLEYVPRYGQRLAEEFQKWGHWLGDEAAKELSRLYPHDPDGSSPIAYLWARTVVCEGPGCGAEIPLIRSLILAKRGDRLVALKMSRNSAAKRVDLEIVETKNPSEVGAGTLRRGSATCPLCGYSMSGSSVRAQFGGRKGGADSARLLVVVCDGPKGRFYRLPQRHDYAAVQDAQKLRRELELVQTSSGLSLIPDEKLPYLRSIFNIQLLQVHRWGDLFSARQVAALATLCRILSRSIDLIKGDEPEFGKAVATLLAFAVDRQADYCTSICTWVASGEFVGHNFAQGQSLPIKWDFAEVAPFSVGSGNWEGAVEWIGRVVENLAQAQLTEGQAERVSATDHVLPDDVANAIFTDPPYYDAIPYADLSDFFYVWLRRNLGAVHPLLFQAELTPKEQEVVQLAERNPLYSYKTRGNFEHLMSAALLEGRRVTKPDGIGVFVFAHKETSAWETMLQAVIDAGWTATASWPIDTEMGARLRAHGSAALASSVHVVCRPREMPSGALISDAVGDWRDVLIELPARIHEWMPRLAAEGVVGADAIFACLGPALEIFSRYSRVEKASGDQVTLREYLEYVWAAVSKEALTMIFSGADATGFEEDARLTAMWLWTLTTDKNGNGAAGNGAADDEGDNSGDGEDEASTSAPKLGGYYLEYDAARKISQGLGAHLERLANLVEVKGDKARLLPVAERARHLFGKDEGQAPARRQTKPKQLSLWAAVEEAEQDSGWGEKTVPDQGKTVLDRVHQSMILFAAGRADALKRFLVDEKVGADQHFWRLAQALSALYPAGSDEKRWVDGVLARKKGLGF